MSERRLPKKAMSREELRDYLHDRSYAASASRRGRARNTKHLVLMTLLTASFLQYYFIDVQLEILSQPSLTVFVPVRT